MNESQVSSVSESELRVKAGPAIGLLAFIGIVLSFLSQYPGASVRVQDLALLLIFVSAIAWLLANWKPYIGRWFTVVVWIAIPLLVHSWLDAPGSLTLLAIPTSLTAIMISIPAAMVVALVETIILLALPRYAVAGASWAAIGVALTVNWAMLGVIYFTYRPMRQYARWSWEHYHQARDMLDEARDRRLELRQALDDLADANLQLTRLNVLAQGLRQAADDARITKEQFVANVSHELRTPINMVVGFSEMIVQTPEMYNGKIPPALLADLAVIHRNAEHLSDLIDDVLDLSQIEAGQMSLSKEQIRFHEIVETAATAVRPLFESKDLYLKTEVPEDLPPVFCDRTRMREVLLNLLSNAGRFTERGGVILRTWKEGNDITVAVKDTGSGIASKDMEKLFKPFQQVDGSIRRRYGGTGLGLNISKQFIELHGGKIWVESEPGTGTTVTFRLPMAPSMPTEGDFLWGLTPDWEYRQRTHPSRAPKTVIRPRFVVLETGDSLQRLLSRHMDGIEIVPATSLETALEELSRSPVYALLVNDISVSNALERMAPSTVLPGGTPAIICSIPDTRDFAETPGASEYLVKPVSRVALLRVLDNINPDARTILIIDDEPDALQLFGRMLASSGREYRVLLARDGQEAINVLQEYHPDVILLDLVMPNMDGFQFLEMASRDPALRDIPFIVVSARDPRGQPIASSALAVTQGGGLSVFQLLASIKALGKILSATGQVGDPELTADLSDSLVYG